MVCGRVRCDFCGVVLGLLIILYWGGRGVFLRMGAIGLIVFEVYLVVFFNLVRVVRGGSRFIWGLGFDFRVLRYRSRYYSGFYGNGIDWMLFCNSKRERWIVYFILGRFFGML